MSKNVRAPHPNEHSYYATNQAEHNGFDQKLADDVFLLDEGNGLDLDACQGDTLTIDQFEVGAVDPLAESLFLLLPVFDIDPDELDEVFVNGEYVGNLQGANDEW